MAQAKRLYYFQLVIRLCGWRIRAECGLAKAQGYTPIQPKSLHLERQADSIKQHCGRADDKRSTRLKELLKVN